TCSADTSMNTSTSMPRLGAGAVFGHYRIGHMIARGANAVVFAGEDLTRNPPRKCRIKVLSNAAALNPRLLEQFVEEVRMLLQLRHPALERVLESGRIL